MKKIAILAAIVLFTIPAFAQVKVAQNGKIVTYEKGSTINISSKDVAEVYYDGVLITIPKGKKVIISQNRAGNILIKGDNLSGVKVAGQTLRSNEPATYIVDLKNNNVVLASDNQQVADKKAQATAKNNNKNANKNSKAAQSTQSATQETVVEVSFPEVDQYVNEIVSEQAVQDVEEQLSPSAPRI